MRKTFLLVAAALPLAVSSPLLAQASKPLAVLSLSSYDAAKSSVDSINCVKDAQKLPTWLSSMVSLYAQGHDVAALDKSRPWGAVIQRGEKLSAYGFLPITNLQDLASDLGSYISNTTEVGDGVYKVVGTEADKELYAKEKNGWLFVSDKAECLADVPADPTSLFDGLDKKYEIGVRLALKNVPADVGKHILAQLDKAVGPALRQNTSDQTVELIGKIAFALDEVTLGWSKR
jgi:hypothetical protein